MRSVVLAALLLGAGTASAAEPWFVRRECLEATTLAYAVYAAMLFAAFLRGSRD